MVPEGTTVGSPGSQSRLLTLPAALPSPCPRPPVRASSPPPPVPSPPQRGSSAASRAASSSRNPSPREGRRASSRRFGSAVGAGDEVDEQRGGGSGAEVDVGGLPAHGLQEPDGVVLLRQIGELDARTVRRETPHDPAPLDREEGVPAADGFAPALWALN